VSLATLSFRVRVVPFLVVIFVNPALAQYEPVVSHFAGNAGGLGIADGVGPAARFARPSGVWSDGEILYVADMGNNTIRRIDVTTRSVRTIAGIPGVAGDVDGPIGSALFRAPTAIWGNGSDLYVNSGGSIRRIDLSNDSVTTIAGSSTPVFSGLPPDGIGMQAQFRRPVGIWGVGQYLYVLDAGYQSIIGRIPSVSGLIRRIDLRTNAVETLAVVFPDLYTATYNSPTAIWGDSTHLYVGYFSYRGNFIGELDLQTNVLRPITNGTGPTANGLWGDSQGNLYASSTNTVARLSLATGEWTPVLGATNAMAFTEGIGTAARLRLPAGIAVVNGKLYVADSASHVIAEADLQSFTMTTTAGLAPANTPYEWVSADSIHFGRGLWSDQTFVYCVTHEAIQKVAIATGEVSYTALTAGGTPVTLQDPMGVWGNGADLYVVDKSQGTLRRIAIATGETTTISSSFAEPTDVWGDGENLYVADGTVIYKVDPNNIAAIFAGSGVRGGADGIGSSASFRDVHGLWGDGVYLYVADYIGRIIRRITLRTGEVITIAGTDFGGGFADGVGPDAQFLAPEDVWGDGTYLYVTDSNRIRHVSLTTLEVTTIAGTRASSFREDGIGTDASFQLTQGLWGSGRKLFLTDFGRVRQIELDTLTVSTLAGRRLPPSDGVGTAARFYSPTGIWGDAQNLYVTDRFSIRRVNRATRAVSILAGFPGEYGTVDRVGLQARFQTPSSLWSDGTYLYVSDSGNRLIRRVTLSTGQVTRIAGNRDSSFQVRDGVGTEATFGDPKGVWGDGTYLYIADAFDHTIRRLTLSTKEVTTIAGASGIRGLQDGIGSEARFHVPSQLSGDGTFLYVTDSFNNAIRRISLSTYEVKTLATFGPSGCETFSVENPCLTSVGGSTFTDGTWLYMVRGNAILKIDTQTGGSELVAGSVRIGGTEDGLASIAHFYGPTGIWSDTFTLYVADSSNDAIRAVELLPPATSALPYSIGFSPTFSKTSLGVAPKMSIGYGRLRSAGGTQSIDGFAIFGLRQNGVLVSEAAVPASPLIRNGRIVADVSGRVNTGIAMANPNTEPANISFYFTDGAGNNFGSGTFSIAANSQISVFLNEEPFSHSVIPSLFSSARTLTFSSSVAIGVIALRGFTNERSEFLITTMPVADLSETTESPQITLFALGGGWTTSINLINPSDVPISGSIIFSGSGSSPIPYTVPVRSSFRLAPASRPGPELRVGSIRVIPASGQIAPAASVLFSFERNGITVAASSIAAQTAAPAVRIYVEGLGTNGQSGSIDTGVALANPGAETATFDLELWTDRNGTRSTSLQLPANGHVALFLNEIPAFADLPKPFRGVLRVSTTQRPGVAAVALRCRYNERGDFLISSTPAVSESRSAAERIFPHLVDGGGYSTQFVLFDSSGNSNTGVLEFYSRTGQPLELPLF